jgi:acyl-CoA hydrolase
MIWSMFFLGRMDEEDRRTYFVVASVILEIVTPLFRKQLEDSYRRSQLTCLQDFLNHQQVIHTTGEVNGLHL